MDSPNQERTFGLKADVSEGKIHAAEPVVLLMKLRTGGGLTRVESAYLANYIDQLLSQREQMRALVDRYATEFTKISLTVNEAVHEVRRQG